jgi:cell division protein ZapB
MPGNDLIGLQKRVIKLLAVHDELLKQNQEMRAAEAEWQAERAQLIQRYETVRRKVNEMVIKLQTLERNSG